MSKKSKKKEYQPLNEGWVGQKPLDYTKEIDIDKDIPSVDQVILHSVILRSKGKEKDHKPQNDK